MSSRGRRGNRGTENLDEEPRAREVELGDERVLLISVKPQYAEAILDGTQDCGVATDTPQPPGSGCGTENEP